MKWLIVVLFSGSINARADDDFKVLQPKNKVAKVLKTNSVQRNAPRRGKTEIEVALDKIKNQGERVDAALGRFQQKSGVWDFTNEFDFKTGTTIRGILLNSVVSTNLESPLVVQVQDGEGMPSGARFSCMGVTKYKRVMSACNKMILPDGDGNNEAEFEVKVSLLNTDGSSGLKADEVYTGKEEYIAGAVATAFSRGMIEAQTDRIASPFGELTANTAKNRLTNGLLGSLGETNDIMKSEMQSKEPKVYVKAGKLVLIYFHERFRK
jgi:hypothetical protein